MNIFICSVNTTIGFHIAQTLRRDHVQVQSNIKIYGSIVQIQNSIINKAVSQTYNFYKQREQMLKKVLQCDFIIMNISVNPPPEIQFLLKVLKQHKPKNKTKIIGISNYSTWGNTKNIQFINSPHDKQSLLQYSLNRQYWKKKEISAESYRIRVAHPTFNYNYELQNLILEFNQKSNFEAHIVCTGNIYGKNSEDILDLIQKAINCQQQICFAQGQNNLPFVHIDNLLILIEDFVYKTYNTKLIQQEYIVLCEIESPTYKQVLEKLNKKFFNQSQIKETSQILFDKYDILRSLSLNIKPNQQVKRFLNNNRKQSILGYIQSQSFNQFYDYFSFESKQILIQEELINNPSYSEYLSTLMKKYYVLNKIQLNSIAIRLVAQNQNQLESKQNEDDKKKNASKKDSKKSVQKQPYQLMFPEAIKQFILGKSFTNFIICLNQQSLIKILNVVKQVNQNLENKFKLIRLFSNDNSNNLSQSAQTQRLIQINSDEFFQTFNLKKIDIQQQKEDQQKQNDETKIDQSEKNKRKSLQVKINSDIQQSPKINLLSQYLLDNLIVYIVQAKYQMKNKEKINNKKLQGKQSIKLFLQELKKIKQRQTVFKEVNQN